MNQPGLPGKNISLVTFPYNILTSFRRIRRCTCGVSKAAIAAAATKGGRPEQLEVPEK